MSRVSREDWIEKGFELLRDAGEDALTVARLCSEMGKSKGSFYHHFRDQEGFEDALLNEWMQRNTQQAIDAALEGDAQSGGSRGAAERLERLDEAVSAMDHRLDQAIRRWAQNHAMASQMLKAVDKRRIDFLVESFEAMGAKRKLAKMMAELEYIACLGAQQWCGDFRSPKTRALQGAFRQASGLYFRSQLKAGGGSEGRKASSKKKAVKKKKRKA